MRKRRRIGERIAESVEASDIVQPQPKASAGSMALGVIQLCVCELILEDDTGECGNGEATLFIHGKRRNIDTTFPIFLVKRCAAS